MLNREELIEFINNGTMPILANLGYDLIEVKIVMSHGRKTVQIFIDKPGGVTVEDCAIASRKISELLDQHQDVFPGRYYLEISSPGAERPLTSPRDFERFRGKKALIRKRIEPSGVIENQGYIEDFAG
ncbi:MAG: ribosome maturation factor RimP, partial [bacterium]